MVTWVLWGLIVAMLAWMGYNYLRIRRAAKIVDNAEFESLIRTGQLIDLREPADFHRKHILGARNIPSNQLKTSLATCATCNKCSTFLEKTRFLRNLYPLLRIGFLDREGEI